MLVGWPGNANILARRLFWCAAGHNVPILRSSYLGLPLLPTVCNLHEKHSSGFGSITYHWRIIAEKEAEVIKWYVLFFLHSPFLARKEWTLPSARRRFLLPPFPLECQQIAGCTANNTNTTSTQHQTTLDSRQNNTSHFTRLEKKETAHHKKLKRRHG